MSRLARTVMGTCSDLLCDRAGKRFPEKAAGEYHLPFRIMCCLSFTRLALCELRRTDSRDHDRRNEPLITAHKPESLRHEGVVGDWQN